MNVEFLESQMATDPIKAACYELGRRRGHTIGQSFRNPAVMRAAQALYDLRYAMQDVRQTLPRYVPGREPTAADNCREVLEMIDHGIKIIATYLEVPIDA